MNLKYPYKEVLYLQYYNELGSKEIGEGIVIYEVNGVTYTIQGAVSKQELIKMLENREKVG